MQVKAPAVFILIVALGVVVLVTTVNQADDSSRNEFPPPALQVREGDSYHYTVSVDGQEMGSLAVAVGTAREVIGPDLRPHESLPLSLSQTAQGSTQQDAGVAFQSTTGLGILLSTDTCIAYPQDCGSDSDSLVLWQTCPYGGLWSPLDVLPAELLLPGNRNFTEPIHGKIWTLAVKPDGPSTTVTVEATGQDPSCDPSGTLVLKNGRVTEIRRGNGVMTLEKFSEGAGRGFTISGVEDEISISAPTTTTTTGPLPAGSDLLGPSSWRLSDAWSFATADTRVASFLAKNPGAILMENNWDESPATLQGEVYEWRFSILGSNGQRLQVVASHNTGPGGTDTVDVTGPARDRDMPERYTLVPRPILGLQKTFQRLDAIGLQRDAHDVGFQVVVAYDGAPRPIHTFVLGTQDVSGGDISAHVLRHYVNVDPWTGRATDAILPISEARTIAGA